MRDTMQSLATDHDVPAVPYAADGDELGEMVRTVQKIRETGWRASGRKRKPRRLAAARLPAGVDVSHTVDFGYGVAGAMAALRETANGMTHPASTLLSA
jgi:hypothetical protein